MNRYSPPGALIAVTREPAAGLPRPGSSVDACVTWTASRCRVDAHAKAVGSRLKKYLPHFGTDMANRAARLLHGQAAGGDAFIGTAGRAGADHPHAAELDIEFVGCDLSQRGHDALPNLHFSGRNHYVTFGRDFDP